MKLFLLRLLMFITILIVLWVLVWQPPNVVYWNKFKIANTYINKIEQFQSMNQRLPSSLSEIGEVDSEKASVYYQKINENEYQMWFGTTLGESLIYNSITKEWK